MIHHTSLQASLQDIWQETQKIAEKSLVAQRGSGTWRVESCTSLELDSSLNGEVVLQGEFNAFNVVW